MKNLVKLILPIAAFALASAGAVSTKESEKLAPESGWRINALGDCVSPVTCNNESTTLCTIGGFDRFRKVGMDCVQPLYHEPK